MNKRLFIIFMLGFSSGLPLGLITSTLQAWYADAGMSVMMTGMLSLISLPYLYRFFVAPFLDQYELFHLGKRRSWMLLMQLALLLGFNLLAWFSPKHSPQLMAFLALLIACCSAIQDVAIDAQRTEYLPIPEQGIGASLAVFGYRLALLIAGGVALVMAHSWGWAFTYRCMGFFMLVGVLATLWSQEPPHHPVKHETLIKGLAAPLKDLYRRNDIVALIFFILFYKTGQAFTTTTSGIGMPFLIQGLGFSLATIGYINKILGIAAILAGGLLAGLLLIRWSLYQALLTFGLFQALTNLLFVALALVGKNVALFATAVVFDNFASGMGSTALVAFFMRLVNRQYTATQYSILVAISSLPTVFSGPMAALIQQCIGWVGLFQLSFILALGFIPFLLKIRKATDPFQDDKGSFNENKETINLKKEVFNAK